MAWQDELVPLVRTLINDTDEDSPTYTDDRLETAIIVAARLVMQDCEFPVEYAADIKDVKIEPDPTEGENRDESFINLVSVRTACIIDRGSATQAAGQAIRIKDGSSEIDLREMFKAKLQLINKGWCAVYDEMKLDYQSSGGSVIGAAIMGPFRVFARGYGGRRG